MIIKWIMVSPGDEIELFDYGKLSRNNEVVYLMDEHRELVATLSKTMTLGNFCLTTLLMYFLNVSVIVNQLLEI